MSDPINVIILHFINNTKVQMDLIWIGNLEFFEVANHEDSLLFSVVINEGIIETYHLSTCMAENGVLNGYNAELVNMALSFGWDSSNLTEGWANILCPYKLKNYISYIAYDGVIFDVYERDNIDEEDMFKIDNCRFEIGRFDHINLYFITINPTPHKDRSFVYIRSNGINRYGVSNDCDNTEVKPLSFPLTNVIGSKFNDVQSEPPPITTPVIKNVNRAKHRSKTRSIIIENTDMLLSINNSKTSVPKSTLHSRDTQDPYASTKVEKRASVESSNSDGLEQPIVMRVVNNGNKSKHKPKFMERLSLINSLQSRSSSSSERDSIASKSPYSLYRSIGSRKFPYK